MHAAAVPTVSGYADALARVPEGALPEALIEQAEAKTPNAFQTILDAWKERGKHEEE